jgi:hypothetical protein
MTTPKLATGGAPVAADSRIGADRGLDDRRASYRVPVEGPVLIWRVGQTVGQSARMRDVSPGGALLETAPLPLGEAIRVEIEGDYSAFTMDAVVTRSRVGPGAKGLVGVRFVDSNPSRYAKWLEDEYIRLSLWTVSDNAQLIATNHPVIPESLNDPVFIPVHPVFQIVKSAPGTSLADLLSSLESFDRMNVRIAVARLIESRTVTVMKPAPATEEKDAPSPAKLMRRIRESLWSAGIQGLAIAILVGGLLLGLTAHDQGLAASVPVVPARVNAASVLAVQAPVFASVPAVAAPTSANVGGNAVVLHARSPASVRSGPGKAFRLVEFVAAGDELLVTQRQGPWYRLVSDHDNPRWIHESLVRAAR